MTRFNRTALLVVALTVIVALPAMAQDPWVTKRVLSDADGATVIELNVSAGDRAIYGILVEDASASIDDIISPGGWAGISSDDAVAFRTVDSPITTGASVTFRIVTANRGADLRVSFRDAKSYFGWKKTI